ncbi:ATPase/histidine kinase/DNA gyrase B/HSP90 domain containing protein [Acanthamoeba castellanii str. Neff]|uniref:ATPase/histidine kinase/DNA gyrase B/HSP90 domain containing protein n=1 Tax=Acanthamoeba castellanii (strain ATCC 30010 / Neff) TaxID=1257118 RepID=L8HJH9_ACACF|nr:ATPase/histidine kinase/DNA gyrase B/HSP90 domain containing protein [Acanthamoeba castellanii str. Neff]ELR25367.1 ATPase/histidine kinase/DNA gyrase B/HSP90 domain containing protein [Acanthamoeba castellanii str. Neff]
MAVQPGKIYEGLPLLFGSFFVSKDREERRKCAVLLCTILLFILYNFFLVCSALFYDGPFFTFLRSAALTYLVVELSLVVLLYYTQNLYLVTALFLIDIDMGTVVVCFNFGLVSEYMLWLLFIPTLLFYIMGATAGLRSLIFIVAQISLFVFLSCYVIPPSEELVLLPPVHKWFVVVMSYLIVGTTAFVHETSRYQAIGKLKSAIKEREEAHDQLQEATHAKSQFMANISHARHDPTRDNAEIIRDCGEHMLALINNILDIERIESKRLQLECLPFKPVQELEALLKVFAAQAEQKRIQLRKCVDVRYPVRIGDPLRIKQILFNLVSNAIKFTGEGGTVTVRIIDESEDLRVEVEDNGIGIAEEHLCQLFKAFSQVDASITRRYGGSGLGLAISQRLCESMGGQIHCTSAFGRGSKFWFTVTLPIHSQEMESFLLLSDEAEEHVSPCTPSDELPSRRVLFVEDNIINQKVGVRMLRSFGCSVRVANNGLECIQAMDEEEFDAVLMDCQMPLMDGFEATRKIRERELAPFRPCAVAPSAAASHQPKKQDEQAVVAIHPAHPNKAMVERDGDGRTTTMTNTTKKKATSTSPTVDREAGGQSAKTEQSSEGGRASDSDKNTSSDDDAGADSLEVHQEDEGREEEEGIGERHGGTKAEIGHIPIIALTASATTEYRRKCIDSGMDDWLPKPFDKTKLCHILNKWLTTEDERSSCGSCSECSSDDCSEDGSEASSS